MAQDFIGLSLQFIAQNWINIAWGLLIIFFVISYIIINNIQFNKPTPEKPGRRIILETLKNAGNGRKRSSHPHLPVRQPESVHHHHHSSPSQPKNHIQDPDFNKMIKTGFCNSHKKSHTLEKSCNKLSRKSCSVVNCCVYAHNAETNKATCVAGDEQRGPIYKTDDKGSRFSYDYWYYLGKKYNVKN